MHCINISHPDYKALENSTSLHPDVLKAKISLWMDKNGDERFPTSEELGITTATVNATLKIISAFDKLQRNVFTADKLQGWINDLQKQGVSNQQIELFKEVAKPGMTKGEIATAIAASYSYTVEINTATKDISKNITQRLNSSEEEYNSIKAKEVESTSNSFGITKTFYKNFENKIYTKIIITNPITNKLEQPEYFISTQKTAPTDYYSNLTVPGGTNYTENEIATPGIVPSIKGHAQFATDKGIGWFRSDDKENKVVGWKEEDDFLNSETAQYNPITKDDKIIFGHPTIGKSYLKQKGNRDFITLDDDYADEVNTFIDANRGSETRQEYKGRKPQEYNEFMLNLFDRLKVQAKKEGKKLFVSNTNILKERMSEFDKVITIPKDEFKKRFDARGATYGFEDWKSDIDATVAKVDKSKVISTTGYLSDLLEGNPKTRRILEVQSDLFQKGRDKENLILSKKEDNVYNVKKINSNKEEYDIAKTKGKKVFLYNNTYYEYNGYYYDYSMYNDNYYKIEKNSKENTTENKFLQLLNKNNNWVTFFVKSIIQDSAKKGYEKVLFPSGDTASKVEGHTTLEEFKKDKEDRIKKLEEIFRPYSVTKVNGDTIAYFNSLKEANEYVKEKNLENYTIVGESSKTPNREQSVNKANNEINQLKQELERVEGPEGFGALRPIYNFYENTVTNVLKKQGYSPKQVTDEYGNTWNEVEIKEERDQNIILYQKENPAQAKARILKQLNANKEGFINPHKYGELLKLVGDYNKINGSEALQMLKAVNDYYYIVAKGSILSQVSNETKEAPIKELDNKLKAWAKTHGISIEAIDTLIERFGDRYEKGILGVADFANALIGIADNAKIDTLPEEIAHFAVELMKNDPSVVRALQTVDQTEIYGIVKEEYKDIYKNEEDFRKEAVGKILAQEIVNAHKNENAEERGFWAYLKAIKEKFVKWVKKTFNPQTTARQELETILKPLAISILNNEKIGTLEPSSIEMAPLYQKEEKEKEEVPDPIIENKKKFLEEAVFQLQARMKKLKAGLKSVSVINAIDSELNKINQDIAKGEMDLAISRFIKLASGEIASITKTLLSARESGNINSGIVTRSQDFLNMYDNIFNKFLKSMYDNNIPVEETEELRKQIHNIAIEIRETKSLNSNLLQKVSSTTLDAANTDANGNKIDPDFDPDMVAKETSEDVSNWRLQVGNYKYADSKLLKAAHKIIFDSVQRIKRFATKTGNDLLSAQQAMLKSGGKIEDLIETDSDGNLGHFFIQEYDLGKYYKEMAKTKEEIAKALGFENYNDIQVQFLSKEDLEKRNTLWKQFFAKNTKKEKVISKTSRGISTVEISVPNDSYKSKKFEQAMQNPATKAYYELLIKTKKEAVDKLPLPYRTQRLIYMVPPMLKSTIERVGQIKGAKSFMGTMAALASESLFINQDETQFGQLNPLNNKMVPIYFTRELDSSKDLSYDVARTVTLFSEMAENFREKNKIAGDLGAIQYTLAERNYFNKKGQRKEGIETNEYKALEILLDSHVFGIERDAVATKPLPENKITKALGIAGKQFSWTKASQRFATFIRNNNLAFNIPTSISGWLKGSGDSIIEDAIGIYTTTESKNWARGEFFSNLFQVIGELGKAKQTNKMHLMLQQAGVVELERMLYETTKNRAIRKIANRDLMYTTFATGDYGIKGRVALAIYDNYRLYNGQFVTRANYFKLRQVEDPNKTQKEFKKEWSELREKSLYNAYDVVDGNLAVKPEFEKYVTPEVLNSAAGKIENVTTYVDGTMSKTDKGRLARTFAGDFLLMHRGWFFGMVDTRFRREGTNMITEEEEIGTYRASFDFLFRHFFKTLVKDRAGLQAAFATWDTLSPAKKRGVAKTALDLLYLNIVALVASMANLAADDADDEDWTTQYLAYQMNRLLLEQGAAWSPAELVQMIDEPVVGARMIKDLLDISEAFSGEVYESGMYKGATHAEKYWFRKQPFKNLYEMQYPELKNRFIKNLVDSKVYDWMSPEQVNSVTNKGLASSWLIPTGLASDQDTEDENMKVIVDSLQEETEEENGFN